MSALGALFQAIALVVASGAKLSSVYFALSSARGTMVDGFFLRLKS